MTNDLHELFQEHAAIRQYDSGQRRELAEAMAVLEVICMHLRQACACWN